VYDDFAAALRDRYPATAAMFEEMREEEIGHRQRLTDLYRERFGDHIPLIRREDVKGFVRRQPPWMVMPRGIDAMRKQAAVMELETLRFYRRAAAQSTDAGVRKLLDDLADAESKHEQLAGQLLEEKLTPSVREEEEATQRRLFVLQVVQPGLAGLMDGSVSTLAPIFAAAFATQDTWQTFLVGLSASVGAGISMGFTEAAHDDGKLSGRGSPLKRGIANGVMTSLGGLGHTLPYLIPQFWTATTVAAIVVFFELWAIAFIQNRYMETPFLRAAFQVVLGGALVFAAGVLIGNA